MLKDPFRLIFIFGAIDNFNTRKPHLCFLQVGFSQLKYTTDYQDVQHVRVGSQRFQASLSYFYFIK